MKQYLLFTVLALTYQFSNAQKGVGIGTNNPLGMLHVDTGLVLFTAALPLPATSKPLPLSGPGNRMFWYPDKSAFRGGGLLPGIFSTSWDQDSIGRYSFSYGINNRAKGYSAFATGGGSIANGNYSFTAGTYTIAQGDNTVATGYESIASGGNSIAMGSYNKSIGPDAFTAGFSNEATGSVSVAIGNNLVAKSGMAVGYFNDESDSPGQYAEPTDRLFQIGNGFGGPRKNALTILNNGNTGIGELLPEAKLHIAFNSSNVVPQILVEETQNDYGRISFKNTNTSNVWSVVASPNAVGSLAQMNFFYLSYGDVLRLFGNGNAILSGALTQNSDARLKTNIAPLTNSLSLVANISGYRYQWKDTARDNAVQIGLLAQEVKSIFPELVKEDETGMLSVNYNGFIPLLLESVKELKKLNDMLRKEIEEIKKLR